MATKVNRAATEGNKKGGRHQRRNRSIEAFDSHKHLRDPKNQDAFLLNRHESVVRRHDELQNQPNEARYPGGPEIVGLKTFMLFSDVFEKGGTFREKYTAEGEGLSPSLRWAGGPAGTSEFALVCEEIELASTEPIIHWLVYRIPPDVHELPEGIPRTAQVESLPGVLQGIGSDGKLGYAGPYPPLFDDWHHYRFTLYALDAPLRDLRPGLTYEELIERMGSHVLGEAEMVGRCRRVPHKRRAA